VFRGNRDKNTIVKNKFRRALLCRYVRIHPHTWRGTIALRAELYGIRLGMYTRSLALGVEDGRIPSRAFSASSVWDRNHGASNARLNAVKRGSRTGAWSSRVLRRGQWLQVDVGSVARITGVATQGRQDHNQWVTRYSLAYSKDGIRFKSYRGRNGKTLVFRGNSDRNTIVFNRISNPSLVARYVRFVAVSWRSHISMRVELYGKRTDLSPIGGNQQPLGVEDRKVPNNAITASSEFDPDHGAKYGRLNNRRRGRARGGWSAKKNARGQWIQVRLRRRTTITAILTQGRQDNDQWVKTYTIKYSSNGKNFKPYTVRGRVRVFLANGDRNTVVDRTLRPPILAKYVRVYPRTWHGHISMRIELKGRRLLRRPRPQPSGISNGRLPNKYITASSEWDRFHAAWLARLHRKKKGRYVGAWSSRINNRRQWIQVDLRGYKKIYKIVTQGRHDANQWVTSFKVRYSQNKRHWTWFKTKSRTVVFRGNRDRHSLKVNAFNPPFTARYVRVYPRTWHRHISLRLELYVVRACKSLKWRKP
ncbi:predicted protein, partial [Nematostella vectensis]